MKHHTGIGIQPHLDRPFQLHLADVDLVDLGIHDHAGDVRQVEDRLSFKRDHAELHPL